jgi:hypothetical protein
MTLRQLFKLCAKNIKEIIKIYRVCFYKDHDTEFTKRSPMDDGGFPVFSFCFILLHAHFSIRKQAHRDFY